MAGKVTLVGAGPGGLALMTVGGLKALEQAEVVVYDRLVDGEILARIPPAAERIDVGKRAGRHPVPQEEINRLLLERALAGRRVVRLKGGDSILFGRGGEELEALARNGVAFEVIPGVTSALAASRLRGHPGHAPRLLRVGAHHSRGTGAAAARLEINYGALRQLGGTMVFLMSVATFGEIAAGLIGARISIRKPRAPSSKTAHDPNSAASRPRSTASRRASRARASTRRRCSSSAMSARWAIALTGSGRLPLHGKRVLLPLRRVVEGESPRAPSAMGPQAAICPRAASLHAARLCAANHSRTAGPADSDMPSRSGPACGEAADNDMPRAASLHAARLCAANHSPHSGTADSDMPSRSGPACGETADGTMPSRSGPACGEAADNDMPSRGEAACGEALRGEPLPHSGTADSDMPSRSEPACGEALRGEPLPRSETAAPEMFANRASDDLC